MNRLRATFARLRRARQAAFIPFLTIGDPTLAATRALVREFVRQGADVIELGIPFSDPVADGPVIQRSSARALRRGVSVASSLALVRSLRQGTDVPLVVLSYVNPLLAFGLGRFARTARASGLDGVVVPDLPVEEAGPLRRALAAEGVAFVPLVAPTSGNARMRAIGRVAGAFLYSVSLTGTTGARRSLPAGLRAHVAALRRVTARPICVGFGISTAAQVRAVAACADGAIVGSAIVRRIEQIGGSRRGVRSVGVFVGRLARAAHGHG